jgi:hypothetical protein
MGRGDGMKTGIFWVIVVFGVCMSVQVNADSMRCGKKLVKTGDSTSKVLATCGEPMQREFVGVEKTKIKEETDQGNISETKEVKVEKWTYNFGAGTLLRSLTFKDGMLVEIETGDRI